MKNKSDSDNNKQNFLIQESLIVYVNHVLLCFYFCQSIYNNINMGI